MSVLSLSDRLREAQTPSILHILVRSFGVWVLYISDVNKMNRDLHGTKSPSLLRWMNAMLRNVTDE